MTEFKVEAGFLSRYPVQQAGGRELLEPWIPSEDLEEFDDHVVGLIHLVASYRTRTVSPECEVKTLA